MYRTHEQYATVRRYMYIFVIRHNHDNGNKVIIGINTYLLSYEHSMIHAP